MSKNGTFTTSHLHVEEHVVDHNFLQLGLDPFLAFDSVWVLESKPFGLLHALGNGCRDFMFPTDNVGP